MSHDDSRLCAAIDRNFAEVNNALLKRTAYNSLCRESVTYAGMSFFVVVEQALYNDMIANAMRALDEHKDAASFWYVVKCNEPSANRVARSANLDIAEIRATSSKLKHVREKTHFHIDRTTVVKPSKVWADAGITGDEFTNTLHAVAAVLSGMKVDIFGGESLDLAPYDGSDVGKIVTAYEGQHGRIHGV